VNLEIIGIRDSGVLEKERILFRSKVDLDIGGFAIFRVVVQDGTATNGVRSAYWFPDKKIKEKDLVVLYTKTGVQSERQVKEGYTSHFFYWHRKSPEWGNDNEGAVVLSISRWSLHIPASEQTSLELKTDESERRPENSQS
jgi:hypothetical protein